MIDLLIAVPIVFFYLISILSCGLYVTRHFSFLAENILLRYGFGITCGLGVFGFVWGMLAAIPNAMNSYSVFILLVVFIFLGREYLSVMFNDTKSILTNVKSIVWSDKKYLRWMIVPLILYLLMSAPLAFNPLGTDALAFYFAQAKLIAYAQHFVPLAGYESFAQIPLPAELNYTALILMGSEWAARFITTFSFWACTLLIAGGVYKLSHKNLRCTWLSVFLLLTSTGVTLLISDGKTDLFAAMLGFAACYMSLTMPLSLKKNIVFLGVLIGLSFTAKLSYVPILVPMIGFIVFVRLWRENNFKQAVIQCFSVALIIGPCVILSFLPNFAKNYMAYGEPLAPFMFFKPNDFAPFLSQSWFSPEITHYILSIYPLAWTFGQFPMQHGNLSPFVWAALPAVFFVKRKRIMFKTFVDNKPLLFAVAGGIAMIVWAIFYSSVVAPRYVFPALFAFIPIAAVGLDKLWGIVQVNRAAHFVFIGFIFVGSFMVVINDLPRVKKAARNILQGPQETQLRNLYAASKAVEDNMPEQGRLFLAAWERALLSPQIISCLLSSSEQGKLRLINDSSEYWQALHQLGTNVVLINVVARKDVTAVLDPKKKPNWLNIEEHKINDNYLMYVILPNSNAPKPKLACGEVNNNYRQVVSLE